MPRISHTVGRGCKPAIAWQGWGLLLGHLLPHFAALALLYMEMAVFIDYIAQMYTILYLLQFKLQIDKSRGRVNNKLKG